MKHSKEVADRVYNQQKIQDKLAPGASFMDKIEQNFYDDLI